MEKGGIARKERKNQPDRVLAGLASERKGFGEAKQGRLKGLVQGKNGKRELGVSAIIVSAGLLTQRRSITV